MTRHRNRLGRLVPFAFARAAAQAVSIDPRVSGVPSTKGILET
jgi:hypothetical protein